MKQFPVIAITSGEPAGIGPDICLAQAHHRLSCRAVILADRGLLAARAALLGLTVRMREFDPARAPAGDELELLHVPLAAAVSAGTLAGTTTSLQGAIANNAVVNFNQVHGFPYSQQVKT